MQFYCKNFEDTTYMHTISNHPVHIMNGPNSFSPSSFIPFCSFGGNMSVMGETVPNFGIPVCNKFKPTILKGQLCYQVDINQVKNQVDRNKMMSHGLVFMMDYNTDRNGLDLSSDFLANVHQDLFDMQTVNTNNEEAMIYIETLGIQ